MNVQGKTIKRLYEDGYDFDLPLPHLDDETVGKIMGAGSFMKKIDGVWHRASHADKAIEFTDGSVLTFEPGYSGDPIELELLPA